MYMAESWCTVVVFTFTKPGTGPMAVDGTLTTETVRMKRVQAEWVDAGRGSRTCLAKVKLSGTIRDDRKKNSVSLSLQLTTSSGVTNHSRLTPNLLDVMANSIIDNNCGF